MLETKGSEPSYGVMNHRSGVRTEHVQVVPDWVVQRRHAALRGGPDLVVQAQHAPSGNPLAMPSIFCSALPGRIRPGGEGRAAWPGEPYFALEMPLKGRCLQGGLGQDLTSPEARSTFTRLTPGMAEISARTAFSQCSQLIPVTVITLRLMPESYPRIRDRRAV